jgi:hypothetical protein
MFFLEHQRNPNHSFPDSELIRDINLAHTLGVTDRTMVE